MELAGLLMRTEAVRQTGELFVGYFYQYDDNDFTVRMRSKGWGLEVVPAARAWKQPGPALDLSRGPEQARLREPHRAAPGPGP